MPMPKTNGKLTLKQRAFLKQLSKTLNPTEAAFQVYDCKDRASARVIACENLTKLNIPFNTLMEKMGLTEEEDIKDLKRLRKAKKLHACDIFIRDDNGKLKVNKNSNDFIEIDDNQAQLKALELTQKMKGRLKDGIVVDQSKHTYYEISWRKNGKLQTSSKSRNRLLPLSPSRDNS